MSRPPGRRQSERAFRALLRLLPADFRGDYGREMERVFREQRRDARQGGAAAAARMWMRAARDILAIAPAVHAEQIRQDIRDALRGMRRNPGFVAVAIVTLALGIGANTAMFSIVNAVLLRPLPYGEADRLVAVWNQWDGTLRATLSDPEYLDYAERSRTLDIAAMATGAVNLTGGSADAERVLGASITANMLDVLQVPPQMGRGFSRDEETPGRGQVVLIGDALWRRRFAGDPSIVGRSIPVNGVPHEVIGVLGERFRLPTDFGGTEHAQVITPLTLDRAAARNRRGGHYLRAVGRVRPGVAIEAAARELQGIVAVLMRAYPDEHDQGNFGIVVGPLREDVLGPSRPVLMMLLAAVGVVLLIACANVANLLLARAESRRGELAVRSALGASRVRLVRQLLTESCLLALAGAAAGLLVAAWSHGVVLAIDPSTLPRIDEVGLDRSVLTFTALLAVLTGIGFGTLPALQLSRVQTNDTWKAGTRGAGDRGGARVRAAMVVAQVSLSVVLVTAGGLLIKSLARASSVPSGIDAGSVLTLRVAAPAARYPAQADAGRFFSTLLDRVRTLPGVTSAGAATGLPMAVQSGDWSFDVEGRPIVGTRHTGACDWHAITPGYFESLGVRLVSGRLPLDSDVEQAPPAIFLNETAARLFFPNGAAIGQRMRLTGREQPWRTIAGIVGDVHHRGLEHPARPEMYIPLRQFKHFSDRAHARALTLVLRTTVDPMSLASAVRGRLKEVDPEVPAAQVRDMREVVAASLAARRLNTVLVGSFAALALALAAIGVSGLLAYHVGQRTREIGVRLAVGASRRDVLGLVIGQGMRLVAAGLLVGIAAALATTGALADMLFAVGPRDLTVFAAVPILLAAAGVVACYLPARRASRVDPLAALRSE